MIKIAVVLSGCGFLDGAEIRESVLALLSISRLGAEATIFAPDMNQYHVVNHLTGEETGEKRNIMVEAARIARGKVEPLDSLDAKNFDALVIPGGFGVAKNLSDLAFKGKEASVLPSFKRVIDQFIAQKKPVGAICIAPAVLVAAVGNSIHPTVTVGSDRDVAAAIEAMGGRHQNCATDVIAYDAENRIVSCSAYMRDDSLARIAEGIEKCVTQVVELADKKKQAA